MPYNFTYEHKLIPRELDRRFRISEEDKLEIARLYKQEKLAIREIARLFEGRCSRRSIQFILFPERLVLAKEQFRARRKDGRYKPSKVAWAKTMREHRHYKQSIKEKLVNK